MAGSLHNRLPHPTHVLPLPRSMPQVFPRMKITLPGIPMAKARARTVRRGTFVHTYDPQESAKQTIKNEIEAQISAYLCHTTTLPCFGKDIALAVAFCFFMPYPKDANQWIEAYHIKKPDLDNLEKLYLDCMNGIAYHDDSQIAEINSTKIFSDKPRTEIHIMKKTTTELKTNIDKILALFSKQDVSDLHKHVYDLYQLANEFKFESDPEIYANAVAKSLIQISQKFSQKLAKIKRIGDSPKPQEVEKLEEISVSSFSLPTSCANPQEDEYTTC